MNFEEALSYLSAKKDAEQTFPFGPDVMVLKIQGKIFALMGLDQSPARVNLKCDPTRAEMLRELYPAVTPGYHMNKKHWNTVVLDGSVPDSEIRDMMDESYDLVAKKGKGKKKKGSSHG